MRTILYILCTVFLYSGNAFSDVTGVVRRVYDGDTVTVETESGNLKVRLYGIDAPEAKQAYGQESRLALIALIMGKTVTVQEQNKDRYGRTVGIIILDGVDINLEMLRLGHAWCYRQYCKRADYIVTEYTAREEKKGLWATENPQPPWLFRKGK